MRGFTRLRNWTVIALLMGNSMGSAWLRAGGAHKT